MSRWSSRSVFVALFAFVLVLPLALGMDEAGKKEVKPKPVKVGGAYAKLDLSDEQKAQIKAVQDDIKAKIDALKAEERERIEAILTAEQKQQMQEQKEAEKADADAKKAAKDAEKAASKKDAEGGEGDKPKKDKDGE